MKSAYSHTLPSLADSSQEEARSRDLENQIKGGLYVGAAVLLIVGMRTVFGKKR